MANIRHWLEEAEKRNGELIEVIVVGKFEGWNDEEPQADENVRLTREAGLAKLDKDFHDGYGAPDCHPMFAWSRSWVYFIAEYDGATWLKGIPRHPIACRPVFGG